MNVLITGGAGFIGTYLSRELYRLGHRIRIVDIDKKNMVNPDHDNRVVDILHKDELTAAMQGIDLVVHLAAKHRFFGVSEKEFFQVNEEGTKNVLEAMDAQGVKKHIFYSTVAVYGETNGPTNESIQTKPNIPYGLSKLAAEECIKEWAAKDADRSAIVIRPTVIFGPHNKGNVYRLIRQIYKKAYIPIGEGDNIKSIAHVENIVEATIFLMNQDIRGIEIYNYADSPHMPYKEIVKLIYSGLGRNTPTYHLPLRPMINLAQFVDKAIDTLGIQFSVNTTIQKMNKSTYHRADKIRESGFVPRFSSKKGLERMVEWYVADKTLRKRTEANGQQP